MEEPIVSKEAQREYKLREFRQYISQHNVVLAIVKFLLSIKNSKEPIENPLKALQDYFGDYRDPSWDEFENTKKLVEQIVQENQQLHTEIDVLERAIVDRRTEILRLEEEEKLRQEEELNKKASKKQTKK